MFTTKKPTARTLAAAAGVVLSFLGCSSSPQEKVASAVEVINHTRTALSSASITSVTGTYGGSCSGRAADGSDTWTISISGGPAGDELSVIKNDTACVLTFTDIITADGTFVGAPAIAMGTANTYAGSASSFALSGQPVAFYGNAKISALTYAANFTITLLVSDAPNASSAPDKSATYATETGSVSASSVGAPDYSVDFSTLGVTKDVNNVVQSVSGYEQLTAGSVAGQDYVIYTGALTGASTFDEVDTAWSGGTPTLLSSLTSLRIPASEFGLTGIDLDTSPQRTVIVRNTVQGVSAYEVLLVTFVP